MSAQSNQDRTPNLTPSKEDPLGGHKINNENKHSHHRALSNTSVFQTSDNWLDLQKLERIQLSPSRPRSQSKSDNEMPPPEPKNDDVTHDSVNIRKNSSFYRNAAFLQHALSKRPSVLDLGHLIHDPADSTFDPTSSISIDPKPKTKKLPKAKRSASSVDDSWVELNVNEIVSSIHNFKESFAPDPKKLQKLALIHQQKNQEAVELRDSSGFWQEPYHTNGFLDVSLYEEERQIEDEYLNGKIVIEDIEQNVAWHNIDVNKCSDAAKQLCYMLRKGVPNRLRSLVWSKVSGVSAFKEQNPDFYETVVKNVFGRNDPTRHIKVPTFGGSLHLDKHFLTPQGKLIAKRILCIIALDRPDLDYCPMLPDLVCISLLFLNEEETFILIHLMLEKSQHKKWFFQTNLKENKLFIINFEEIIRERYCKKTIMGKAKRSSHKKIYDHIKSLGIDGGFLLEQWFNNFFVGAIPYPCVLRVFDSYIEEGSKIMYRVALGLMKLYHHQILKVKSSDEFWHLMSLLHNQPLSPHHLMKVSFSIDFLRSDFTKLEKKNKMKVSNLSEPHFVYYRPKIIHSSMINPDEEFEIIWSFLLDRYRILDPKLLYYSGNDGFSLKTVFNKCEDKKPTLMLVKTNKNAVFGAFISEEWHKDPNKYFGSSESFVFSLHPIEAKYGWHTGNPTFFAMLTDTTLSIGHGNGCAIWLDSELLNGRTEHCDTFKNKPLHGEENTSFQCAAIEIYTFK